VYARISTCCCVGMVRWVPKKPKNNSQDARDTIELLESKLKNHESLPGEGSGAERDAEMRALQYELATKERRIASLQVCLSVFCLSVCPLFLPASLPSLIFAVPLPQTLPVPLCVCCLRTLQERQLGDWAFETMKYVSKPKTKCWWRDLF
jgi:hypothetical protein